MVTLAQDAWDKVERGLTTVQEVAPLLGLGASAMTCCTGCHQPVRSHWSTCTGCGNALRPRCTCGARLHAGWRYCGRCGAVITPPVA